MVAESRNWLIPRRRHLQEFDYFECPTCQFNSIQKREFAGERWCPLCFEDCGHDVRMGRRHALPEDKVEGFDARKVLT